MSQFLREWVGQWTGDRSNMFFQEYACVPSMTPSVIRHNQIADEYARRTELFDMTLPGGQKDGWWIPYPEHMRTSTRYAAGVREELAEFGRAVGVEKLESRQADNLRSGPDRVLKPLPHQVMPFIHRKTPEHEKLCVHRGGTWVYDDGHTFVEFLIERRDDKVVAYVWFICTRAGYHKQGFAKIALMRMSCFFDAVVAKEVMPCAEPFWIKMHRYGFIKAYD